MFLRKAIYPCPLSKKATPVIVTFVGGTLALNVIIVISCPSGVSLK
jgi:hypothetical protein